LARKRAQNTASWGLRPRRLATLLRSFAPDAARPPTRHPQNGVGQARHLNHPSGSYDFSTSVAGCSWSSASGSPMRAKRIWQRIPGTAEPGGKLDGAIFDRGGAGPIDPLYICWTGHRRKTGARRSLRDRAFLVVLARWSSAL